MNMIQFSVATLADRPEILALLNARGLGHGDLPPDSENLTFLAARTGGRLVGVVGLESHGQNGLLRSLAVAADHQRLGIGRELCDRLLDLAQSRGVERLYLLTTTAEAFFIRMGFRRMARAAVPPEIQSTTQFAQACPAEAVCLTRDLKRETDGKM